MIEGFNVDNPSYPWIEKRLGEKLDYTWDASKDLAEVGNDTIVDVTVTNHEGLTKQSHSHDLTKVWAWFTGGIVGQDMWVTFEITTAGGRVLIRTIYLRIIPR